jgi:hypothetical protein
MDVIGSLPGWTEGSLQTTGAKHGFLAAKKQKQISQASWCSRFGLLLRMKACRCWRQQAGWGA